MLRLSKVNVSGKLLSGLLAAALSASASAATTDLADAPIGATVVVPANVILDISVEFPTGVTDSYLGTTTYSSATEFVGYFNPKFCYDYVANSGANSHTAKFETLSGFFKPAGAASAHTCSGHWSGNFLNWTQTQTIDPLRKTLTGGARISDETTATILQKAYQDNQSGSNNQNIKGITVSADVQGATPFTHWNTIYVNNRNTGLNFVFRQASGLSTGTTTGTDLGTQTITSSTSCSAGNINCATNATTFQAQSALQVCMTGAGGDATSDLETGGGRCRAYGSNYKPVGLMQKYAAESTSQVDSIRYSTFGYLLDAAGTSANSKLDGGVLRAKMKSVGPYKANPGQSAQTNAANEWDASTGVFATNPDTADASTSGVTRSGVVNYLNQFGFVPTTAYTATTRAAYKRYDSVSELYYMATRYYRNLGNLLSHTSTASAITSAEATNDNFPVIATWNDPIAYVCSPNYIVGIGDAHTWNDANVPGSTLNAGNEVADPGVIADTAVNSTTATNFIGKLENLAKFTGAGVVGGTSPNAAALPPSSDYTQVANLGAIYANGSPNGGCCTGNTFYMAGLAYDAHVRDIRPDITGKSAPVTVSTFWLDVMEGNDYHEKNPFWMTAKYGGFNKADAAFGTGGYPTATNGTPASYPLSSTPLPVSSWNTGGYIDDRNNYAPDQYFQAGNPSKMAAGLNAAFAKIVASVPHGNSSSLVLASKNVSSGTSNYAANFNSDPLDPWSGDLIGSQLSFNAVTGVVTPVVMWHARDWLPNSLPATSTPPGVTRQTSDGRIIATSSSVGAVKGVPFRTTGITSAEASTLGATAAVQTDVLNYLRGDQCNEPAAGNPRVAPCSAGTSAGFRPRRYTLGDITNSKPVPVGKPSMPYADTPLNPGYINFVSTNGSRQKVVYVGANDGMMHAFNATTDGSIGGGKELFAYVPSFLFNTNTDPNGKLVGLSSLTVNPLQHHFMVDAQPIVTDVDFARSGVGGVAAGVAPDWHSILISGLGKGGKGYFALDVTNPSAMTTESALAGKVLWETSPSNMGYSFGEASVVKTAKYGWTAVLTSGYNNNDGKGYIYLVNPKDGSVLATVATGAGSLAAPAGLTFVSGFISDNADFTSDALYAGDLLGNVWRVDVSSASGSPTVTKIATLADSSGKAQPVTTRPLIEIDPSTSNRYVFIGTGQLLGDTDIVTTSQQSFYAIIDGTQAAFDSTISTPITRSSLVDDSSNVLTGVDTTGKKGFFIDLAVVPASAGKQASAERITVQPVAASGAVAFAANLVGQDVCSIGSSRVFALNFDTSFGLAGSSLLVDSTGTTVASVTNANADGTPAGVITDLSFVGINGTLSLYSGDSTSLINNYKLLPGFGKTLKKLNWREVPTSN